MSKTRIKCVVEGLTTSTTARLRGEDRLVQRKTPQILVWRIRFLNLLDELFHFALSDERHRAASPS